MIFDIKAESRMSEESKLLYNIFMVLVEINTKLDRVMPIEEQVSQVEQDEELIEEPVAEQSEQIEEQLKQPDVQVQLSKKQYANISVPVPMQESKKSETSKKKG